MCRLQSPLLYHVLCQQQQAKHKQQLHQQAACCQAASRWGLLNAAAAAAALLLMLHINITLTCHSIVLYHTFTLLISDVSQHTGRQ